VTTVMGGS